MTIYAINEYLIALAEVEHTGGATLASELKKVLHNKLPNAVVKPMMEPLTCQATLVGLLPEYKRFSHKHFIFTVLHIPLICAIRTVDKIAKLYGSFNSHY